MASSSVRSSALRERLWPARELAEDAALRSRVIPEDRAPFPGLSQCCSQPPTLPLRLCDEVKDCLPGDGWRPGVPKGTDAR